MKSYQELLEDRDSILARIEIHQSEIFKLLDNCFSDLAREKTINLEKHYNHHTAQLNNAIGEDRLNLKAINKHYKKEHIKHLAQEKIMIKKLNNIAKDI